MFYRFNVNNKGSVPPSTNSSGGVELEVDITPLYISRKKILEKKF